MGRRLGAKLGKKTVLMDRRKTGVMAVIASITVCTPGDAQAQDPPDVRTVSGKAYEAEPCPIGDAEAGHGPSAPAILAWWPLASPRGGHH